MKPVSYIEHDCDLIMEAIRRLIEGTWRLEDDDQIYSSELLPKIKASLLDHVMFEEQTVFSSLPEVEREQHFAEHRTLLAQLWSVEKALREQQAEYFQNLLRGLYFMLKEHHRQFSGHIENLGGCCSSGCAEDQILSRSNLNTL